MSFHKSFASSGVDTSDATAARTEILQDKTAYIASGKVTGSLYSPKMQRLNSANTSSFSKSFTTSGNKFTVVVVFRSIISSTDSQRIFRCENSAPSSRASIELGENDVGGKENRLVIFAQSTSTTTLFYYVPTPIVNDGALHSIFWSFDADNNVYTLMIDGTHITSGPTTAAGTLWNGASSNLWFGSISGSQYFQYGELAFCGYRDAYLTNYADFFQSSGMPKKLDTSSWTEWGAQPQAFHPDGNLVANLGSLGAFTANGASNIFQIENAW